MRLSRDVAKGGGMKRASDRVRYLAAMTTILWLVFSFGANGLNTDPFWTDEMFSVGNMGGFDPPRDPAGIVTSVSDHFPDHVPLFFLMGAGWASFVGWTQFALRLLPVLAGVLLIAWIYRLGTDMFNRQTGVVAAILMGTSAYVILYTHDFRMYSLFLMFAGMHSWLYRILLCRQAGRLLTWLCFVISTIALLYIHLFSLIFFASLGVFHLFFVAKSRCWLKVVLCWAIGAAFFLPYLPVLLAGIRRARSLENVTTSAASAAELLPTFLRLLTNGNWVLLALIVTMLALAIWHNRDIYTLKLMMLPVGMLIFILLSNALIGLIPLDRMRYFIILWVPCVLFVAYGLTGMPRLYPLGALVLFLWIVSGYQFYRSDEIRMHIGGMSKQYLFPPMQDWAFRLEGKVRSEDYLLGFSPIDHVNRDFDLGYSTADYYTHVYLGVDGAFIQRKGWGEWLENNINRHMSNEPFLLFLYDPLDIPSTFDNVYGRIQEYYLPCEVVLDDPDLLVQRYSHPLAGCDRVYQPIRFDNGIAIVDRFGEFDEENNAVRVVTGWEVSDEAQLDQYNISLQILDSNWEKFWQDDWHLYNRILKWHEVEMAPTRELEPGHYRVVVILYDRETNKKVQGHDLTSGETGDILPLMTFSVEA